jgi:DNA-binding transcriptional LysR family regulator
VDLKDLKFFIAVYESGGFSSASRSLSTVQSNVSTRIQELEEALGGGPLFERRWRSVVPTANGDRFYVYAKELMSQIDYGQRMFKRPVQAEPPKM